MTYYPRSKKQSANFIPATDLRRMARGRWREILVAAGVPANALEGRHGRPCPKCGGRDRFAPMKDFDERGVVICRHCLHSSSDPRCGDGIATLRWWLGVNTGDALRWLSSYLRWGHGAHSPSVHRSVPKVAVAEQTESIQRFDLMAGVMHRNMTPRGAVRCAELLGLPVAPLDRLQVGWSPTHQATAWPMRDADGAVIGIRLRCPTSARKWALTGSRAGLIYDPGLIHTNPIRRLWVVEGPTDSAALLSIDLDVVGVPSAGGSADLLVALARRLRPWEVVVVADADDAGQRGAEKLRDALLIVAQVRVITPPPGIKDSRAWVGSGADRHAFERAADSSKVHRVVFQGGVS